MQNLMDILLAVDVILQDNIIIEPSVHKEGSFYSGHWLLTFNNGLSEKI